MKLIMTLILLSTTIFAHSFNRNNSFFFETTSITPISVVSGYGIGDTTTGIGTGLSLRGGYHYNISDEFYIEPVINFNLTVIENTATGQNTSTLQTVDTLTTNNLYGLMFRIGAIRLDKYGIELVLGLESTTYSVDQEFATYVSGTKIDDFTSTNFVYGLRFIGFQIDNIFGFQFNPIKLGAELLTQSTSFEPIQNINESWDVQTTSFSVLFDF